MTGSDAVDAPAEAVVPEGHWVIDADHSSVNFIVEHLGITRLRGRFMDLLGRVESASGVLRGEASVATASVSTGSEIRDRHLQGPDFLNAEQHPRIVFALRGVHRDAGALVVDGALTLNGVTRPVALAATVGGAAKDPYGHDHVGLQLDGEIRRGDFGITFDPSGALVGESIALEIDLSLVREPDYLVDARARGEAPSAA